MYNTPTFRGMTLETIKKVLTDEAYEAFDKWIYGQTGGIDPETKEFVVYAWDFERFLGHCQRANKHVTEQPLDDWD